MLRRPILILVAVIAVFLVGLLAGFVFLAPAHRPPAKILNTATILQQVQGLSQLVTVRYILEKAVILEDPKTVFGLEVPGRQSRVILLAHGVVKSGIDFTQMREGDIQVSGQKVVLRLPPAILTDAYLDDKQTRVLERSTGILRSFDKELEQSARQQARGEIMAAARDLGITTEATERARLELSNFLRGLGFTEIEIREK